MKCEWQSAGMVLPLACRAASQMLVPALTLTALPSMVRVTVLLGVAISFIQVLIGWHTLFICGDLIGISFKSPHR